MPKKVITGSEKLARLKGETPLPNTKTICLLGKSLSVVQQSIDIMSIATTIKSLSNIKVSRFSSIFVNLNTNLMLLSTAARIE